MNTYYIKSKVSVGVFGISGVSQDAVSAIVVADNVPVAKQKFEQHCRMKFAHMQFEKIHVEYLEVSDFIP